MKAMVFAAGLGTRLKPFTDTKPKALVELGGMSLLERCLRRLLAAGVTEAIINIHHFAPLMREYISSLRLPGMKLLISDESDLLLETGGGLRKAGHHFEQEETFLVCNADILTDLSYEKLLRAHRENGALITLSVRQRESTRYLLLDAELRLCGWENRKTSERREVRDCSGAKPYAFSGISAMQGRVISLFPDQEVFSLVDAFLSLAALEKVMGFEEPGATIIDVGKPDELERARALLAAGGFHDGL